MMNLLKTTYVILQNIKSFSILMLLFISFYCLLGMEMFAYNVKMDYNNKPTDWKNPGVYPESTFNDFYKSFIAVFIVLANDGWSTIFVEHYRSYKPFQTTMYFISLKIFGGYILLNLFLAILLKEYDKESIEQEQENKRALSESLKH
jgi:hypothetical protein